MSWPKWTRKATDAGKNALVAGGLATNVHAAADLPKPLADQYSDYAAKVRTEDTRRGVRDRLDRGTRTTASPPRLKTSRNCAKKSGPDNCD